MGDPRIVFVHERSKYDSGVVAFPGDDGKTFAYIYEVTGVDPETLQGAVEFESAVPVVFKLGAKKSSGKGRYLDFVRFDIAEDGDTPF